MKVVWGAGVGQVWGAGGSAMREEVEDMLVEGSRAADCFDTASEAACK